MKNIYVEQLRKLVTDFLKGARVEIYFFGSRAKGYERRTSDIDIAILPKEKLPIELIANLRETIEESTIPYQVDIVDLSTVDETFKNKVLTEGILWQTVNKRESNKD